MQIREINTEKVKEFLVNNDKSVGWLATRIRRSITLTRDILNGYMPSRDFEYYVEAISQATGIPANELIAQVESSPNTAA